MWSSLGIAGETRLSRDMALTSGIRARFYLRPREVFLEERVRFGEGYQVSAKVSSGMLPFYDLR